MLSYFKSVLRQILPISIFSLVRKRYRIIRYFGFRYKCPICGFYLREFLPFGVIKRPNAQCPMCLSLERHRLIWLFMKIKTNLFREKLIVLHFAAEKCISDRLKNLSNIEYITSDISPQIKADIIMDITNIPCNSNSIDVIICNHVLEHVLDDIRAMEELYRVLKLGGWALLDVPFDKKRKKHLKIH